ncbi:unnamed protein product [Strongylus vulgaris]|uniref:Uncharacterized protein n=1 Tax=Strongylus vulgaris TaxID=40348 RepID=A0A3P7JKU9_STRVU|nr:unnamed protein product [Strongylus vulgaris]
MTIRLQRSVRNLFTTNDECAIIRLPHVRLAGLCFLQGHYVVVDAPCSFEEDVKIGVGGDCSGVLDADHETR